MWRAVGAGPQNRKANHDSPRDPRPSTRRDPATRFVTVVGILVAVWCAVFAAISVWFEATGHFADGPHAASADALSIVNWCVTAIKVVGVVAALLAVVRPGSLATARVVGAVLWAGFATVGVYVLGSLGQAVLLLTGRAGSAESLDAAAVLYVLAFLLAAAGFGVLAVSYTRRTGLGLGVVMVGSLGAPLVLGGVLVALPAVLRAVGILPAG